MSRVMVQFTGSVKRLGDAVRDCIALMNGQGRTIVHTDADGVTRQSWKP